MANTIIKYIVRQNYKNDEELQKLMAKHKTATIHKQDEINTIKFHQADLEKMNF